MLLVRTLQCRADPLGQLVGTEHTRGLDHLALAVNPFGLDRVEPRALLGQQTSDDPHSMTTLFDSSVVRTDPAPELTAYVPVGVVRDQHPHPFAELFELPGAPLQKARGYPAYRTPVHEPQPCPPELGRVRSVARDGLRIGAVFFERLPHQTQRLTLFAKAVQVRLRHPAPPALVQEAHDPIDLLLCQPHQSIAPSFFSHIAGREKRSGAWLFASAPPSWPRQPGPFPQIPALTDLIVDL